MACTVTPEEFARAVARLDARIGELAAAIREALPVARRYGHDADAVRARRRTDRLLRRGARQAAKGRVVA